MNAGGDADAGARPPIGTTRPDFTTPALAAPMSRSRSEPSFARDVDLCVVVDARLDGQVWFTTGRLVVATRFLQE